jgi:hypothetical protein
MAPAKKVAPKTKPAPKKKAPGVKIQKGDKHPGGRPPKFTDVDELEEKIDGFFAFCDANEYPYTIHGLCVHIGCTRDTLCEYEKKPQFSDTIKKAKEKIRWFVERELFQGKNPSGMIFWLKNNAGWKDKQETEISGPDGAPLDLSVNFVRPAK